MTAESLILVVNPGSSSRKYALYADGHKRASINFEFVDNKIVSVVDHDGKKYTKTHQDANLDDVSSYILPLFREYDVIANTEQLRGVGVRVVAPSSHFIQDELVTDGIIAELEAVQPKAPLHVTSVLTEIKHLQEYFSGTPVIAISDSAFHATKPDWARYYGFDIDLAKKTDILRYGYHGVSAGSIVRIMSERQILSPKTIICHLGSGSSVTAVAGGKSVDNSMGYTPLEGVVMATRTGDIDVSAALAIKRELNLSDEELEEYLNKKSGLSGVSGSSNDIRQLLASEDKGDQRAKLALDLFVYRIRQTIAQMAASLGGVDSIVFTATVGERSAIIRSRILNGLSFLGFNYDQRLNENTYEPTEPVNLAIGGSKPVWVISTDEAAEIAHRAGEYIKSLK